MREALRLLASQNLIVTTRGVAGGSFVVHPSPEQLIETLSLGVNLLTSSRLVSPGDLLEARQVMEVPVATLAALRRSDADIEALRVTLFDPLVTDFEEMAAVHSAFHESMADACGNPLLTLISKPLHRIASAAEVLRCFGRPFWVEVDADHRAIFEAVVAGNPQQAEDATAQHIEHLRQAFSLVAGDQRPSPAAESTSESEPASDSTASGDHTPTGDAEASAPILMVSGAGGV